MINSLRSVVEHPLAKKLSVGVTALLASMTVDEHAALAQIVTLKEPERQALIHELSNENFPTREKAFAALQAQITPGPKENPDVGTLKALRDISKRDPNAQKTELEGFKRAETLVEQAYENLMAEHRARKTKYPYTPKFMPATTAKLPSNLTPWGPKNDVWSFMQPIMMERLGQSFFPQWDEPYQTKSQTGTIDYWNAHEQGSFDDALNALHFRKAMTEFARGREMWWNSLIIAEERHRKARGWEPLLEKPLHP